MASGAMNSPLISSTCLCQQLQRLEDDEIHSSPDWKARLRHCQQYACVFQCFHDNINKNGLRHFPTSSLFILANHTMHEDKTWCVSFCVSMTTITNIFYTSTSSLFLTCKTIDMNFVSMCTFMYTSQFL